VTACVALVFAIGCDSSPSGPTDPALTGEWISPSVDSYMQFTLQQRGGNVSGTFASTTLVGGTRTFRLGGVAELPRVEITWLESLQRNSFDGTLSDDQQSITGTLNPGGAVLTFHRQPPISGRVER
jgi:hypothetical protein